MRHQRCAGDGRLVQKIDRLLEVSGGEVAGLTSPRAWREPRLCLLTIVPCWWEPGDGALGSPSSYHPGIYGKQNLPLLTVKWTQMSRKWPALFFLDKLALTSLKQEAKGGACLLPSQGTWMFLYLPLVAWETFLLCCLVS